MDKKPANNNPRSVFFLPVPNTLLYYLPDANCVVSCMAGNDSIAGIVRQRSKQALGEKKKDKRTLPRKPE